jgi:hypothetical protein
MIVTNNPDFEYKKIGNYENIDILGIWLNFE